MNKTILWAMFGLSLGCSAQSATSEDSSDIAARKDAIKGGEVAWTWEALRAVEVPGCTGTLVSPTHVLTAAHCGAVAAGSTVRFYLGASTPDPSSTRVIDSVTRPPCVTASNTNDCTGLFADVLVAKLHDPAPPSAVVATMSWFYPGNNRDILKVGRGLHDDMANPTSLLKWRMDTTYSSNPLDGHFLSNNQDTNKGDSGGPAYWDDKIVGVLWGSVFEWLYRDKYSNVPRHLDWILGAMSYGSAGFTSWAGYSYAPTTANSLNSWTNLTARTCRYACEKQASCRAFSFTPGSPSMCDLYTSGTALTRVSTIGGVIGYR